MLKNLHLAATAAVIFSASLGCSSSDDPGLGGASTSANSTETGDPAELTSGQPSNTDESSGEAPGQGSTDAASSSGSSTGQVQEEEGSTGGSGRASSTGSDSSDGGASTGTDLSACDPVPDEDPLIACLKDNCCSDYAACVSDDACVCVVECTQALMAEDPENFGDPLAAGFACNGADNPMTTVVECDTGEFIPPPAAVLTCGQGAGCA